MGECNHSRPIDYVRCGPCVDAELFSLRAKIEGMEKAQTIDIVFDGPPGPVCGRFVEVENMEGKSIRAGEWVERPDGYWALRLRCVLTSQEKGGS